MSYWIPIPGMAKGIRAKMVPVKKRKGNKIERNLKIKCAAIRYGNKIYEGKSHAEIGIKMIRDKVLEPPYPFGDDQGFVTECGRYVRRAPALMIAIRSGQVISGKTINKHELFSEDLNFD